MWESLPPPPQGCWVVKRSPPLPTRQPGGHRRQRQCPRTTQAEKEEAGTGMFWLRKLLRDPRLLTESSSQMSTDVDVKGMKPRSDVESRSAIRSTAPVRPNPLAVMSMLSCPTCVSAGPGVEGGAGARTVHWHAKPRRTGPHSGRGRAHWHGSVRVPGNGSASNWAEICGYWPVHVCAVLTVEFFSHLCINIILYNQYNQYNIIIAVIM